MSSLIVELPEHTTSPIAHLLPHIGPSLERIAPERAVELTALTTGVQLTIADSTRWVCYASPGWRLIHVSTRVIELAWAYAYAYWVYYKRALEGKEHAGGAINLARRVDVQSALRLLGWALSELSEDRGTQWPVDVPHPSPSPAFASDEHVTDEITCCALAFFLHHELAHTYVTIPPGESDLDHERFCDDAAAGWIFSGRIPHLQLQKRALGTAVALLLITSRGIETGNHDGVMHPVDFDRLVNTLELHVPADQEAAWGLVLGVLALHGQRAGIQPPAGEFAGPTAFRDAVLAYRNVLRARLASGGVA